MCSDNAYIYFSDLVPSQNSYVVTEKPLACSQGTSKYADYPLHSCMPWFIDPSEQFENTQLKKKNTFFSYYNFSKFSDGNAVWKRERAVLEALPLASFFTGNEEWRLYSISQLSDETDLCWEILKGTQSTWGVTPMRASLPSFSWMIFEQDSSVCRGTLLNNIPFQFLGVRGDCSPPQRPPLSHRSTKLALLLEPSQEPFVYYLSGSFWKTPWSVSMYRRCVLALWRVRPFWCPKWGSQDHRAHPVPLLL